MPFVPGGVIARTHMLTCVRATVFSLCVLSVRGGSWSFRFRSECKNVICHPTGDAVQVTSAITGPLFSGSKLLLDS